MEFGIKLVVTTVVLLIIALAVVAIYSDNLLDFSDSTRDTEDKTADGILRESCRMAHGGYYYLVKDDGDGACGNSDCSPQINVADADCDPPANGGTTCCCKCK